LPQTIKLTVLVDDPDGKPLVGARITFTLAIPGVRPVTSSATSDENGHATFETTIPKGADRGAGSGAVLVQTDEFGKTTDETPITIKK
jgi:hypothetical protein